jgi:hypothetical protein
VLRRQLLPVPAEVVPVARVGRAQLEDRARDRVRVSGSDAEAAQRATQVVAGRVSDAGGDDRYAARKCFEYRDLDIVRSRRRETEVGCCLDLLDLVPAARPVEPEPRARPGEPGKLGVQDPAAVDVERRRTPDAQPLDGAHGQRRVLLRE